MRGSNGQPVRRRQFLAGLTGVTGITIAGCSVLPWTDDETSGTFPASEVNTLLTKSVPAADWPVPVQPDSSVVTDALERVDELLTSIPDPLTADEVPNGVVRKSIIDARNEAVEIRTEAADATGPALYHALRNSRDARASAREAMTTFTAIGDDTLVSDLEASHADLDPQLRNQREAIVYRGDETDDGLLRSALYYSQLESDLDRAVQSLQQWSLDETATVIDTGEAASELESAAATASVWEHCAGQYETSLEDPIDLEPILLDALERSLDHADAVQFPAQDDDWLDEIGVGHLEDPSLQQIVWLAGNDVSDNRDEIEAAVTDVDLGTGLYHALQFERAFRAFEIVRDRTADGSVSLPDTIDEIRTEREAAIAAAETAHDEITTPSPGALVLAETVQQLAWTDESVRFVADTDPENHVSLHSEYGDYVRLRASLEVLPDAVDAFRTRLLEA